MAAAAGKYLRRQKKGRNELVKKIVGAGEWRILAEIQMLAAMVRPSATQPFIWKISPVFVSLKGGKTDTISFKY
jgi:hypothetical protein